MSGNDVIAGHLVTTGAFRDLDEPVILTSGQLGIYFINTEKLLGDSGVWKDFANNSTGMIQHACDVESLNPIFKEVIDILTAEVESAVDLNRGAISGGQRRDWIFSGPVARRLGLNHISLFKEGRADIVNERGIPLVTKTKYLGSDVGGIVHVSDLLTEGSSAFRIEGEQELGWVPMIKSRRGRVGNLISVVTRFQGGEERLAEQGVQAYGLVGIDEEFLGGHSTNPERALAYHFDPDQWSKGYLGEHGALAFVDNFNPNGEDLPRARRFIMRYGAHLIEAGKLGELVATVRDKYDFDIQAEVLEAAGIE